MTFHTIVKEWCEIYKPMRHAKGNRRFYLTDSTAGVVEMAKSIKSELSPYVLMESNVEGYVRNGLVFRNYPIYFFVKADKMSDGDSALLAKEKAFLHCLNFLSYLRQKHDDDPTPQNDFSHINLEDNIDIQTAGPFENGWFAVLVQIERCERYNTCVDQEQYTVIV